MTTTCPKCGGIAEWDSYHGCYCCLQENCQYIWKKEQEREFCIWCQGGARDLVYNMDDFSWWGDINKDDGVMRVGYDGIGMAARKINYCPMCGRPVGSADKHDEEEESSWRSENSLMEWRYYGP